jgi:hypothetical protein
MMRRRSIFHRCLAMTLPVWLVVWPTLCCCSPLLASAGAADAPVSAHGCCSERAVPSNQPEPDRDQPHGPCMACPTRAAQQTLLPATFTWPDLPAVAFQHSPVIAAPATPDVSGFASYPSPSLQAPTLLRLRCALNL